MKSIMAGLALSLLGGVAMAQNAPAQPPGLKPPPPAAPSPPPAAPGQPTGPGMQQPSAQAAPPAAGTQGMQLAPPQMGSQPGQFEGEIVETPDGVYLVRPGQAGAQRLHFGQGNQGAGTDDDEPMDAMGDAGPGANAGPGGATPGGGMMGNGMPHHPPPHHPPEGQGARFRIKTPNMTLGIKCPDDEPIKACVDAVSQLLDKANPPAH